jgi:hypothetical protein
MNISSTRIAAKIGSKTIPNQQSVSQAPLDRVTLSSSHDSPSAFDGVMGRALIGGAVGTVAGYLVLGQTGPKGLAALVGAAIGTGAALPAAITDYIGSEKGWSPAQRVAASLGVTAAVAAGLYLTA